MRLGHEAVDGEITRRGWYLEPNAVNVLLRDNLASQSGSVRTHDDSRVERVYASVATHSSARARNEQRPNM